MADPAPMVPDPVGYLEPLLEYIQDRRVIPVIGPEITTVGPDGLPIDRYLAKQFAQAVKLDVSPDVSLSEVVAEYLRRGGKSSKVSPTLYRLLTPATLTP